MTTALRLSALLLASLNAYVAFGYYVGSKTNDFPGLQWLFLDDLTRACLEADCWRAIMPFYAVCQMTLALLALLCAIPSALGPREASLVLACVALKDNFQAFARIEIVETWGKGGWVQNGGVDMFVPGIYKKEPAARATLIQTVLGGVVLLVAFYTLYQESKKSIQGVDKTQKKKN